MTRRRLCRWLFCAAVILGCAEDEADAPEDGANPFSQGSLSRAEPVTLVGAGDISRCGHDGDEQTAALLDSIPGIVFTVGDNVYPDGTEADFANCYEPSWGRHKARTRPTPGNHAYRTNQARDYYKYFGSAAGPGGRGYYGYGAGAWLVLALNSNVGVGRRSAQMAWVRQELARTAKRCVLAYWHHPLFSSGEHGGDSRLRPVWEALYEHGAEIVVVGHDHVYERFAPQTPRGTADPISGIRQFTVGTGGASLRGFRTVRANSELRDASRFGVLKLELGDGWYRWWFVTTPGGVVADSGQGTCHDARSR